VIDAATQAPFVEMVSPSGGDFLQMPHLMDRFGSQRQSLIEYIHCPPTPRPKGPCWLVPDARHQALGLAGRWCRLGSVLGP